MNMKIKQILFTAPKVAEIVEREIGDPAPNEVRVRLAVSTVSSGTERSNLIGDPNISYSGSPNVVFPRALGYSSSGIVEAVGVAVTDLNIGDRVAMSWTTHSQAVNIDRNLVYKLPDGVSFSDGALTHIAIFPLAALRKCRLELGESAIVMGMGILGLLSIPLLKAAGAAPIIAVDPIASKREKAMSLGADLAFDPNEDGFADKVKQATGGGANVGIEVTGIGAGLDGILDCMARFGRVALLGCTRNKNFTIDYYRKVHGPGITLIGAHTLARPKFESHDGWWTQRDDAEAVIKLIDMGRICLSCAVDEVHSPNEAPSVYTRLANEPSFPIVQFDWRNI